MQSRTDQVHSYEFFLQRVVSGLVARESDPAELPFRRLGWSGFGSVMVAVVVAAVFGVIGALRGGGNTSWQEGDSIIVEKGTNNVYLYFDDKLHPMANLISAQLAMNGAEVTQVSARSIEGVPRGGATLGIQGLPHAFPGNDSLLTDAWTLCSQEPPDDQSDAVTVTVLGVGSAPQGGAPVGERAVLIREATEEGQYAMVLRGYQHPVDPDIEDAVLQALQVSPTDAVPVSPAFVDALPEGDELTLPPRYQPGDQPSTAVPGEELRIGDVIQDQNRYYLVQETELDEITQLQAETVARLTGAQPIPLSPAANVPRNPLPSLTDTSPPRTAPPFVTGTALGRSVCGVFPPGEFTPDVLTGGTLDAQNATQLVSENNSPLASYVNVPGGKAVLVQSVSAPDAPGGAWYVVNDQGRRFALADVSVAAMLGYDLDKQVRVSGGLVGLLPAGPDLDPAVARDPVPVGPLGVGGG
ncbi:MAG TPA: type VII secretion protein EccB [Natronosporangium sp.]